MIDKQDIAIARDLAIDYDGLERPTAAEALRAVVSEAEAAANVRTALREAATEIQSFIDDGLSNDRLTKAEAERLRKRIAIWRTL